MIVVGLFALLCVTAMIGGRELLGTWQPWQLLQWEHLLRSPVEQQITGFVVVGLIAVGLLLPFARALGVASKKLWAWRVIHGTVGALAVAGMIVHTGLRMGSNLNLWLTASFLVLSVLGALSSVAMGGARTMPTLLRPTRRLHIILFWPSMALLGLHVLASYYF